MPSSAKDYYQLAFSDYINGVYDMVIKGFEEVIKRLARGTWQRATFLTVHDEAPKGGAGWTVKGWLADLAGRTKDLIDEVATAESAPDER